VKIAYWVAEEFQAVYREIASLLGIALSQDLEMADVVLVDGIDVRRIPGNPLLLCCGPVVGDNPALRRLSLPFDLGKEATRLLMVGADVQDAEALHPVLDEMLEQIRAALHRECSGWLELPPSPWGAPYALALTHDIDVLSLTEMPVRRTFLGYFYRSSFVNWRRWRAGKVRGREFCLAAAEMLRTGAAKLGVGRDVWHRALPLMLEIENRLGVRSALYFIPEPGQPGLGIHTPAELAPANRASYYDVQRQSALLRSLEDGGWETGVHGLDAWHDKEAAVREYAHIAAARAGAGTAAGVGIRMHWLYFNAPESFRVLEAGGFLYDSTFGYNEIIGFRAGTLQPYQPLGGISLWELPLHIQDGALLGEEYGDLSEAAALQKGKNVLNAAVILGGVVTLLWHNQSFTAPRFWGRVYEHLIAAAQQDQAWIALPRDILAWYQQRRDCRIQVTAQEDAWLIRASGLSDQRSGQPPLRLRLHISPERIADVSVPYETGDGYLDLRLDRPDILIKFRNAAHA
jgi:hypothetical protein